MTYTTFQSAYLEWLRRVRVDEPDPVDYGLSRQSGDHLARMVRKSFEEGVLERAKEAKVV